MSTKLIVESSPHIRSGETTAHIMIKVLIALLPALIASSALFGARALLLVAVCVLSCVALEFLFCLATKKARTVGDCSAVVTGVLLAFNLPPELPYWMAVIGCLVAVVIVKQMFGGIGQNFANPAIVGRIVLLLSFPQQMTRWIVPGFDAENGFELVSGATPLASLKAGEISEVPSYWELLFGIHGGSLGETCAIALILGGIILIALQVIHPVTPLVFIGTVAVFSWMLGYDPIVQVLTGGVLLGAIFMATDYSTTPFTVPGKAVFAVGCGLITVLIRSFGSYPEGVSFAILLMNIATPLIDKFTENKPFGAVKEVRK